MIDDDNHDIGCPIKNYAKIDNLATFRFFVSILWLNDLG